MLTQKIVLEAKYQAFELNINNKIITSPEQAGEVMKALYSESDIILREKMTAIYLSQSNEIIGVDDCLSIGSLAGCMMPVVEVAKAALLCNAKAVILAHNHPAGTPQASKADITSTKNLKQALETLEIRLLDHIIITKDSYYSIATNLEL